MLHYSYKGDRIFVRSIRKLKDSKKLKYCLHEFFCMLYSLGHNEYHLQRRKNVLLLRVKGGFLGFYNIFRLMI
jgi:hypothetical protein